MPLLDKDLARSANHAYAGKVHEIAHQIAHAFAGCCDVSLEANCTRPSVDSNAIAATSDFCHD
jgi:hypothetical protein